MNDILIKIDTKTAKAHCEYNKIGVQHANLQNKLIFKMSEKIEGSAWLEYEIGGNKNYAVMEEIESGYQIDIKSCLLISDYVNIDLKITESENADGIPIFISTIVELDVDESINATEEEPEYYPDWKTVADSKIAEMNQLKEEIEAAIEETNNLNIDVSDKVNKEVNITLTKKDNTTKRVTLKDGTSLMFNWDGTRLGIKTDEDEEYTYVDLIGPQGIQGETGTTPNLTIGTVVTGNTSSATITGTPENPILNLVLEKGETGETGATGNGISSIEKTGTQDNVDTYTIYYTNGTTSTFTVTNSTVTNQEFEELKAEHEELVNTLPRVEGTGESITLDNTAQYNMNVALSGNTSQVQYTGRNKANFETIDYSLQNSATGSRNGQEYTITCSADNKYGSCRFSATNLGLKLNTTYTFSALVKSTTSTTGSYLYVYGGATSTGTATSGSKVSAGNRCYITFTTPDSWGSSAWVGLLPSEEGATTVFTDVMIEESSTMGEYEPFVGGYPSPSPLYPQPIKKVTGNNSITVCGKNLLNSQNWAGGYIDSSGNLHTGNTNALFDGYIEVNSNTQYVISTNTSIRNVAISEFDSSQMFIQRNQSGNNVSLLTITTTANTKYVRVQFNYDNSTTITQAIIDGLELQLESGSSRSSYEPYQSQSYPINLGSLEYCKIGNYSDEFALSTGVQLFDKNNANILNAQITDTPSIGTSSNAKTLYIPIVGGTTYTISKIKGSRFRIATTATVPSTATSIIDYKKDDYVTNITITTSVNSNYLLVYFYLNGTDTITQQEMIDSIMINEGSTPLPWEPYGIGNWYLKKNIGKVVLDGTEAYNYLGGTTSNPYYVFYNNNNQLSNSVKSTIIYSNYFIVDNSSGLLQRDGGCRIAEFNSTNRAFFCIHSITSVNDFKTWLATHNTTIYYPLATSTGELITDTTLIEQLNNLYNQIKSYKGQTNITQTNAELPFNIDASALYDLNNLISRVATLEVEV